MKTCKRSPKRFGKKIVKTHGLVAFRAHKRNCARAKKILKKNRENAWFAVVGNAMYLLELLINKILLRGPPFEYSMFIFYFTFN